MFTIRKATTADCGLIHDMASIVFPATYKEIISAEQMEFMMDWMYSHDNIRKQMEEEGHCLLHCLQGRRTLWIRICTASGGKYISFTKDIRAPLFSRTAFG